MQHKKRTYNIGRFKHYLHSIPTLLLLFIINIIMMKKNVKSNVLYSISNTSSPSLDKSSSIKLSFDRSNNSTCHSTNDIRWSSQNRIPFGAVILTRSSRDVMSYSRIGRWTVCVCALALLLATIVNAVISDNSFAVVGGNGTSIDSLAIIPVTAPTAPAPTASLSLSQTNLTSNATAGETAVASTNVTIVVSNAASYSLTLQVDNINMINDGTVIAAGNVIDDNTWGYKWDNAPTYTAPSISGNILVPITALSDDIGFTKTLTFGAKFGGNATAGTYHGSGTLSLVATAKAAATITLADLTQMQQLSLVPEACDNTPYLSGKNYSATYTLTDVRDQAKYTVAKLGDGRCWMTSNLRLQAAEYQENGAPNYFQSEGRKLTTISSDVSSEWILPTASTSGFSDNAASNTYVALNDNVYTGYYSWCAATAGSCSTATVDGAHASNSICPKGWKLPGGFNDTTYSNEFRTLLLHMGLAISNNSLANTSFGYTSWSSDDFAKVQALPYNFDYTGYVTHGNFDDPSKKLVGYWWSSTANSNINAYSLFIYSSLVRPGTDYSNRLHGYAVRCIARDS